MGIINSGKLASVTSEYLCTAYFVYTRKPDKDMIAYSSAVKNI